MSTAVHRTKVVPVGYADCSQFMSLTGDPEPMAITYGIQVDEPPFVIGDALALRIAFVSELVGLAAPSFIYGPIRVSVAQEEGDPVIIEAGPNTPGTDAAAGRLPQNCAILVEKRSSLGGRRNQGRLYLPGILNEAAITDIGTFTTPLSTLVQDAMDNWLNSFVAAGTTNAEAMVLFHSYEWIGEVDPGPPPGFPAPTPVANLIVQTQIATQRRRLRR